MAVHGVTVNAQKTEYNQTGSHLATIQRSEMTETHNFFTTLFIARQPAGRAGTPSPLVADNAGSSAPAKQTVQDMVMLSGGC